MAENRPEDQSSAKTVARQWLILQSIPRSPKKVTTATLEARLRAEGHEVSRRTIERDLHALSARFPLALDDRSRPYGWSWAAHAAPGIVPKLSGPQAVGLLLAREHLQNLLPRTLKDELGSIFELARCTLEGSGWNDWHQRTAVLPAGLALQPPVIAAPLMACVEQAIAERRCLAARYRAKGSAESREMHIHPLGLVSRGAVLYLVCTLFDYEDVRLLAMHRLSDAGPTAEPVRQPPGFDFREYTTKVAPNYLSRGPIELVVRIEAPAADHLYETPLSSNQQLRKLPDGHVEVTTTVQDDQTLRWWLLAFGSQLEVVAPRHLREEIAGEAQLMSDLYQGGMDAQERHQNF